MHLSSVGQRARTITRLIVRLSQHSQPPAPAPPVQATRGTSAAGTNPRLHSIHSTPTYDTCFVTKVLDCKALPDCHIFYVIYLLCLNSLMSWDASYKSLFRFYRVLCGFNFSGPLTLTCLLVTHADQNHVLTRKLCSLHNIIIKQMCMYHCKIVRELLNHYYKQ